MTERFKKEFLNLLVWQMAFVVVIFTAITVLKFFNPMLTEEIIAIFEEYFNTEITLSLVLNGK